MKSLHGLMLLIPLLAVGWAEVSISGEVPPATPASNTVSSILQLETRQPSDRRSPVPEAVHTMWRYWETRGPEIFKLDSGEIFRADPVLPFAAIRGANHQPVKDANGKYTFELRKAREQTGSPFPAEGWREPEFDDSTWFRHEGPMAEGYRGIALVCVRGKFDVQDPARIRKLSLSVGFRGGIVAFLNGKEVGRAFLPEGKIAPESLAEMYPTEAYVSPAGALIDEHIGAGSAGSDYFNYVLTSKWADKPFWGSPFGDQELLARFRKRCRRLEIDIPASVLRKGVNVLVLEIHRAPANEIMYKAIANSKVAGGLAGGGVFTVNYRGGSPASLWWSHAMMEDVRLSVPAGTTGITSNVERPQGFQVWNESTFKRVLPTQYGDPNEPLRPIRMQGLRNGTCSGQIVAGSSAKIRGLRAVVGNLRGAAGVIPASAIQVGYMGWWNENTGWRNDALDPDPPAELLPLTRAPWNQNLSMGGVSGVVEAIWFTAQVPRNAKAGVYTGKVMVSAEGEKTVETAIELKVIGDWVCPAPNRFTTYMGIIESPDSVAMLYHVPLWSEEHWKFLDKTFELLGQLGNRELYIPLITKTMLANEQSMVRWIKQADGSYTPDFGVAERYMDLACKHHWNVSSTCLAVSDNALGNCAPPRNPPSVTTLDSATQAVGEMAAPAWGTPEARTFWKPAIEGLQERLKKRGMEKSMLYGFVVQNQVLVETIGDLKSITPDIKWWEYTHWSKKRKGTEAVGQDVGRAAWAFGAPLAVFWNPDEDKPHYAWKNLAKDVYFVASPRGKGQINVGDNGELAIFRLTCESTLLGNADGLLPEFGPFCGIGQIGADFWPVKMKGSKEFNRMDIRYVYWGSLNLSDTLVSVFGTGQNAPAPSCRTQLLRESQQEAEARVFVQNAILDETQKAKLGTELAERCRKICDDRTRALNFCSVSFGETGDEYGRVFSQEQWDAQTELLYRAAGDVAKAIGGG